MNEDNRPNPFTMHCDACGKDYVVNAPFSIRELKKWLGKPCSECGANMLTDADFRAAKLISSMLWFDRIAARVLGRMRIKTKYVTVNFHTDTNGGIEITSAKEEIHD